MSYLELEDLKGKIPDQYLVEALDDSDAGAPLSWDAVLRDTTDWIDAYLAGRHALPLAAPVPPLVRTAARNYAAYLCYQRRGTPDESNPFYEAVFGDSGVAKLLSKVAAGAMPLRYEDAGAPPEGAVISFPSSLGAPGGLMG